MISIFSHKGQSLLELVVSVGLLVIVVTALAITTINGLRNSQLSENQTVATKLAQEGIDNVKNIRARNCQVKLSTLGSNTYYWYDTNLTDRLSIWTALSETGINLKALPNGTPCQMTDIDSTESLIQDRFTRLINLKRLDDKTMIVTSTVSWTDSTGPHSSVLTTYLTNY